MLYGCWYATEDVVSETTVINSIGHHFAIDNVVGGGRQHFTTLFVLTWCTEVCFIKYS